MSLAGSFQLAWRYVAHHRARTLLLALALGMTLALPLAVRSFVVLAQQEMRARAEATPLVLGAKSSSLELVLNALYFRRRGVEVVPMRQVEAVRAAGLGQAIPLYVKFHAQEAPVVGTSLEYFTYRSLRVKNGVMMSRLGDCVVGAALARQRSLKVGGAVVTSSEQVFDLAGVYPLKMHIAGILAENGSQDDHAIFVDVKTAWLIEGLAHGHEDLVAAVDSSAVLSRTEGNVVGSKALRFYNEVTAKNIASFHFHGDAQEFPLTAVLVLPHDAKARAILLGRFQKSPEGLQLVVPSQEMEALLATLIQAESLTLMLLGGLGVAVFFIAALVFALSFKMRRREFATLEDIGISRTTIMVVKALEIVLITAFAACLVTAVMAAVEHFGPALVRVAMK